MYFQILTSVPRESTTAVLMLCATIPRDRTTVHANLDIMEMDGIAKVEEGGGGKERAERTALYVSQFLFKVYCIM